MTDGTPYSEKRIQDSEDAHILLGVLDAVERNSHITQRTVAQDLGIALGLANAYLKRCIRKGFVKVSEAPARRYIYYLTPNGFAEKSRLTASYLVDSFSFFRRARGQCSAAFETAVERGYTGIVLLGVSDLAEIAILCAREFPLKLVGIVDPSEEAGSYAGLPLAKSIADLSPSDAALLTDLKAPQRVFELWAPVIGADHLFTPNFLRVHRGNGLPATRNQVKAAP